MIPVTCKISASGAESALGTRWFAELANLPDGRNLPRLLVGKSVSFRDGDGPHVGLAQSGLARDMPELTFQPDQHAGTLGPWTHFLWPTVLAESGGRHLTLNSYDRARFTFGFYQLAAHTPDDNLVLLFRRLLQLPNARAFLPDLRLERGRIHLRLPTGGLSDLETVVEVKRPNGKNERQLLKFMQYLNKSDQHIDNSEVEIAGRLMGWLISDPAALNASVEVAITILRRKLRAAAIRHGLMGGAVEPAIWVSDILHQGRGTHAAIGRALAVTGNTARLNALSLVGAENKSWDGRRKTVEQAITRLMAEGRFSGLRLGEGPLGF